MGVDAADVVECGGAAIVQVGQLGCRRFWIVGHVQMVGDDISQEPTIDRWRMAAEILIDPGPVPARRLRGVWNAGGQCIEACAESGAMVLLVPVAEVALRQSIR